MTASTKVASRALPTFPVPGPAGFGGIVRAAIGQWSFAATDDEAGDKFSVCKIPAGATVIGGYVQAKDLDTGTEALDIDIGWAATDLEVADPDGFGNLGLWSGDAVTDVRPEVGIFYNLGGVLFTAGPKTFTAEATVQFTVNTAANTLTAGNATVVLYYIFE